jgi:DNA-binding CsgD family transcriptional regulator
MACAILWDAVALAEQWGQYATSAEALHDLVRMGSHTPATERLEQLQGRVDGEFMEARLRFAQSARSCNADLAHEACDRFEQIGARLFAAEAAILETRFASAGGLHRRASAAGARADGLLEQCEGARALGQHVVEAAESLSDREREVALLAARDLTSRDIADRLFISVRTVDNHLQRVYTKLGITGRSELAEHLTPGASSTDGPHPYGR